MSWKRRLGRIVLSILITYLLCVLMFALLQRWLIYLPSRAARIDPQDADLPAGQVHTITVRTDDGLELRGWHVLPNGQTASDRDECDRQLAMNRPLALYFSGNGGNRRYRTEEFGVFARLGCDVFIFDYRGYGDNGGSPSEELLAADAQAAWRYATEERNVTPGRIILYGESLGGGVATRLASELSESGTPPGGLVLRSTFSSLVDVGAYHYPWLPVRLAMVDRFPSTNRIPGVTCPILHIHGTRDSIVPIKFGQELFAAAPDKSATGIPKRFVELPRANHNDVAFVAEREMRQAIGEFLDELRAGM
jgi:fermentation-respiration switch protein FrsA (DUF1100 family)